MDKVIDPLTNTTAYVYCDCGALEYVTNALGQVTHHVYDYQGRRIQTYFPDNTSVPNWYDSLGRVVKTGDGLGYTTNVYNLQGLLTGTWNAAGLVREAVYDIEDHPIEVTDANGVTVENAYDALGRLIERGYPDSGVESWVYTTNVALTVTYTNQLGNVTISAFDAAGRKTNEVYVGMATNRFTYNPASDLLTLKDGRINLTNVTTWAYDTEGRVTYKYDAKGTNILAYLYDANGRLTNRWSKAKSNTRYKYDIVGNLTNVDYNASTDLRFKYDALYQVTNIVDAAGTTAYSPAYTAGGSLQSEHGLWRTTLNSGGKCSVTSHISRALTKQCPPDRGPGPMTR